MAHTGKVTLLFPIFIITNFFQNVFIIIVERLRALALKNANAIFKPFLTFYGSKCAASKDAKYRNCKSFYNSATVQFNIQNCTVAQL